MTMMKALGEGLLLHKYNMLRDVGCSRLLVQTFYIAKYDLGLVKTVLRH